jgi:hypothetical protein
LTRFSSGLYTANIGLEGKNMNSNDKAGADDKPAFEPSELVDYGDAEKLTRGPHSSSTAVDGTYTS